MPPKRRQPGPASARQSTLTFNGVTKPSARTPSGKAKKLEHATGEEIVPSVSPNVDDAEDVAEIADTTAEKAVLEQALAEAWSAAAEQPTPEETEASKISEARIKKYWRGKEKERLTKRVHQDDVPVHERILREFDISAQFGPSIGIARMKRWKRAHKLGLGPPVEVLAVLLKEQEEGNLRGQRSHVDELMNSRFTEV